MTDQLGHAITVFYSNAPSSRLTPGQPRTERTPVSAISPLEHGAATRRSASLVAEPGIGNARSQSAQASAPCKELCINASSLAAEDPGVYDQMPTNDSSAAPKPVLPFTCVYGHTISRCDSLRTLLIDGDLVRFTPTEYRLLIPILQAHGTPVPFRQLTCAVLEREPDRDSRRLLDKHIDHIRSKIRVYGFNVHCVARFGYVLLAEQ